MRWFRDVEWALVGRRRYHVRRTRHRPPEVACASVGIGGAAGADDVVEGGLAGGFEDVAPEGAFYAHAVTVLGGKSDGDVNEAMVDEADEAARAPRHGGVDGVGSEPGTVDVIDLATLKRVASVDLGQQAGGIDFWKIVP